MLGPVGGRIVAEVLLGLLAHDPLSYLSVEPNWTPVAPWPDDGRFDMPELIRSRCSRERPRGPQGREERDAWPCSTPSAPSAAVGPARLGRPARRARARHRGRRPRRGAGPAADRDRPGRCPGSRTSRRRAIRGIEPGSPARSLLFHALASPNVTAARAGSELGGVPDAGGAGRGRELRVRRPAAVPGRSPRPGRRGAAGRRRLRRRVPARPSRPRTSGTPTCASPAPASPGSAPPSRATTAGGGASSRSSTAIRTASGCCPRGTRPTSPCAVPATRPPSCRCASGGRARRSRATRAARSGCRCTSCSPGRSASAGLDLTVALQTTHVNEKLRRIHLALGPDASLEPARHRPAAVPLHRRHRGADRRSATSTRAPSSPSRIPRLVEPAVLPGPAAHLPGAARTGRCPRASTSQAEGLWRHGPEYVHVRSRLDDDGTEVDLNETVDVAGAVAAGGVPRAALRRLHRRRLGRGGGARSWRRRCRGGAAPTRW